ncbi:hypothetical protein EDB85DRAFT_1901658 [Lactarius pseudohatsudake]|nr:hypothetical protein EDB85DRAFT_1901658 [Lactarius pseudohatsudake]
MTLALFLRLFVRLQPQLEQLLWTRRRSQDCDGRAVNANVDKSASRLPTRQRVPMAIEKKDADPSSGHFGSSTAAGQVVAIRSALRWRNGSWVAEAVTVLAKAMAVTEETRGVWNSIVKMV